MVSRDVSERSAQAPTHANMAGRVSDPMRAIRRRYGIDEALVSTLAREGIEINFVDDRSARTYGTIVITHAASGTVGAVEPIYVIDGDFGRAIVDAIGQVRGKARAWAARVVRNRPAPVGFAAANFGGRRQAAVTA